MNNHYIRKNKTTRDKFHNHDIDPIEILEKLQPRVVDGFTIQSITIAKTKMLISKFKTSNSTGWDNATNCIFKHMQSAIAPFITHLFNSSINSSIF